MAHLDHLAPLTGPDGIRTESEGSISCDSWQPSLNDSTIIFTRRELNPFTGRRPDLFVLKARGQECSGAFLPICLPPSCRSSTQSDISIFMWQHSPSLSRFVVSLILQNKFNLHSLQSLQPMLAKYIVNRTHISLETEKQSTKFGWN